MDAKNTQRILSLSLQRLPKNMCLLDTFVYDLFLDKISCTESKVFPNS